MEILDHLEQRIASLLSQLDSLKKENASLRQEQATRLSTLTNENAVLRSELLKEQKRNKAALTRIDTIIQRIKDQTEIQ